MNKLAIAGGALAALWLLSKSSSSQAGTSETPARDLTKDEALGILLDAGVLQDTDVGPDKLVTVASNLGGATYRYTPANGQPGVNRGRETMDPRLAVLLLRLGSYLRQRYGIVYIDHAGIYPGNPSSSGDMHNRGLAADLVAFYFQNGTKLDVLFDWGNKTAKPGQYRLSPTDRGYQFFKDVYALLSAEGEGGGSIGQHSFLITPDHPDTSLAEDHRSHIHVQVAH